MFNLSLIYTGFCGLISLGWIKDEPVTSFCWNLYLSLIKYEELTVILLNVRFVFSTSF